MSARSYLFVPLLIASVAALGGATYVATSTTMPSSRQPEQADPAPVAECVAYLSQVGLTPETLAAAGVSIERATTVLTAARLHLTQERREQLRALDAQVSAVTRRPSTGDLAALRQARATAMEELWAFATLGLSGAQRQALQQMHANRAWPVPTEYKVLDLPEHEWIGLRDALAANRLGGAAQATVPHGTDLGVINARAGLDNAASIKQQWDMAMQP